jgi:ABC-2 type transport system ATP-binding protein
MQQRLGLACAMINDPQVIFLDEPASALDPIGRNEVRLMLQGLRARGKTIFLNSHLLEDVEVLCDKVALLNNGQILQSGTVAEVLQEKIRWRFRVGGFTPFFLTWLAQLTGLTITQVSGNNSAERPGEEVVWLEAELEDDEQIGWVNSLVVEHGLTLYEVHKVKTRLDEWFVSALSGVSHRGERL